MKVNRFYKTWGESRSVRLQGFNYAAPGVVYHIIIGSSNNAPEFVCEEFNQQVIEIVQKECSINGHEMLAYCLMPDHLHLLVRSLEACRSLPMLVRSMKSFCTKATGKRIWQAGFYEHVMRSSEDVEKTAQYIVNNPVRKGLVHRAEDYPWGGVVGKWS